MREAFLARQAIFDPSFQVQGYELLFRSSALENRFSHTDPDEADERLRQTSLYRFGLDSVADGRWIYLNATRRALVEGLLRYFPQSRTVVEVLETVTPDPEVLRACHELKEQGYRIALDDFVFRDELRELLDLADIVKVDFLDPKATPERIPAEFGRPGLRFLAEKIESEEDLERAQRWGYTLFQGYYLRRPEILRWERPEPPATP